MSTAQIVVATTTAYGNNDHVRASLAQQTFTRLYQEGMSVSVVDGGSEPQWCRAFQATPGVQLVPEQLDYRTGKGSMGAGRRQAMALAAANCQPGGVVVWMEPEKLDFVRWIKQAAEPILLGQADLVLPKRKSLHTYPLEQQLAEQLGNLTVESLLGQEFDFWFGPRLWSPQALHHMLDYAKPGSRDYGDKWDSIMIPCLRAMADGLRVVSVEVGYEHPPEQTQEEEGDVELIAKRIAQLHNIVPALRAEVVHLGIDGKYAKLR